MSKARRYITAGGTLVCALGIGYFMQSGGQNAPQSADAVVAAREDVIDVITGLPEDELRDTVQISDVTLTSAIPAPPMSAPQPAILPAIPGATVQEAAFSEEPRATLPLDEPAPGFGCEHTLKARPVAAAMVELSLSSPCMINQRFTLHNNGMMFTDVTDDKGMAQMTVPALAEQAVFIVSFGKGAGTVATAQVSTMEYYDRVVVQWKGRSGLELHALEYGAGYDDPGHVWAEAPRDMGAAAKGEGGFLARYGDLSQPDALLAEVYTFPAGTAIRGGNVSLSVEAEVTARNCGRDVEAQTIQINGAGKPVVQDLTLAMPECSAIGDFLMLKNMINDLKIARN